MPDKLSYQDFSAKIKAKYPDYRNIDDLELAKKIVSKYPEYGNSVMFDTIPETKSGQNNELLKIDANIVSNVNKIQKGRLSDSDDSIERYNSYDEHILNAGSETGSDPNTIKKLMIIETGMKPGQTSPAGYFGLPQTNEATIETINKRFGTNYDKEQMNDPDIASKYVGHVIKSAKENYGAKSLEDIIVFYNAGAGNYRKWKNGGELPKETQQYIDLARSMDNNGYNTEPQKERKPLVSTPDREILTNEEMAKRQGFQSQAPENLSYQKDFELPTSEQPDYMGLFNKKEDVKIANQSGVSVSFFDEVKKSAAEAEYPTEYIARVNNLKNRIEQLPNYFPELKEGAEKLKPYLSQLNTKNIDAFEQQLELLENSNVGNQIRGGQFYVPSAQRQQYNDKVKTSPMLSAIRMLNDDNVKLLIATKDLSASEKWGALKGAITASNKISQGSRMGIKQYVEGYTELLRDIKGNEAVNEVLTKLEGEQSLTTEDKLLLKAIFDNQKLHNQLDKDIPTSYKIGEGLGQSIGFMGEFVATGGGATSVGKSMLKYAAKLGLTSKGAKLGLNAAIKLAQTGIHTPMMPSLYQKTAIDVSKGEDFGTALFNNAWQTAAETGSERIFMVNPVKGAGGAANRILRMAGINFNADKGAVGVMRNMLEEYTEEKVGEIMTAPKDYENFKKFWDGFTDAENNLVTFGSTSLLTGGMGSVALAGNSLQKARYEARVAKVEKILPADLRAEINQIIENKDISVQDMFSLISQSISERIDAGELTEDPATVAGNAIAYANAKIKLISAESTDSSAKIENGEITVGEFEEDKNEQEKLDYLKEQGVTVPGGTTMEGLDKLYSETLKAESEKMLSKTENIIPEMGQKVPNLETQKAVSQKETISQTPKSSQKVEPVVEGGEQKVKPIRQLGTGSNVYFETNKYRVNDNLKTGKTLFVVNDITDNLYPVATIEFDTPEEAVRIAKIFDKQMPNGIPEALDAKRYIEQLKKEGGTQDAKATTQKTDVAVPEKGTKGEGTEQGGVRNIEQDRAAEEINRNIKNYKKAKSDYDSAVKKNKKYFNKDGSLKSNTPSDVVNEVKKEYDALNLAIDKERQSRVVKDNSDTGLVDGIKKIRNSIAYNLVEKALSSTLIPPRLLNEFGLNLKHIVSTDKDGITGEIASIINDFIKREDIKKDDVIARELQAIENKRFEESKTEEIITTPKEQQNGKSDGKRNDGGKRTSEVSGRKVQKQQVSAETVSKPKTQVAERGKEKGKASVEDEKKKVGVVNRLIDGAKEYDKIPNTHTTKKANAINDLRKLATRIGYGIGKVNGKIVIYDENQKPVSKKIPIRQSQEVIQSHKALNDYEDKKFTGIANKLLSNPVYLTGIKLRGVRQAERAKATEDILSGKKSVAANNLLDAIEEIYNKDLVVFSEGSSISLTELMESLDKEDATDYSPLYNIPEFIVAKIESGTELSEKDIAELENAFISNEQIEEIKQLINEKRAEQELEREDRQDNNGIVTQEDVAETETKTEITPTEEKKVAATTSIKPKNLRDVYKAGREIFGLNKAQALAQAIVVNSVVNRIAKNRGVTADKVWSEIEFKKGVLSKDANALYQAVWHGSPHEFDKFRLDKIGTGEGAQAFGWGLYFTDKISIAKDYARKLSKQKSDITYNGEKVKYFESLTFLESHPEIEKSIIEDTFEKYPNSSTLKSFKFNPLPMLNSALTLLRVYSDSDLKGFVENGKYNYDSYGYYSNESIEAAVALKLKDLGVKIGGESNLYKVKLHGDRSIDEFNYLRWDKEVDEKTMKKIVDAINYDTSEESPFVNRLDLRKELSRATDGRSVYGILSKHAFGDKEASLFLLRAGIDGIKYPTESTYKGSHEESFNYVIFDENVAEIEDHIKFQKQGTGKTAKGAITFLKDGNAIIHALTNPNVSTPLHEIAHLYERYMPHAERKVVLKWTGDKEWTTEASEKFARGFEKYLADGIAPTAELKRVFDRFKKWLTEIYNGITGSEIDLELNEDMAAIYASMLGVENVKLKTKKTKYKELEGNLDTLFQVTIEQAKELPYKTELPKNYLFAEAVKNTPDAKITDEGLVIKVVRFQTPEQEGEQSVRTGVFYLPASDKNVKYYKASNTNYGGKQKQEGETLIKKPIFVKGATGGKAPESAYDNIKGKGAYQKMRTEVLNAIMSLPKNDNAAGGYVAEILDAYGADSDIAWEIVRVSKKGNTLSYAIQENIVAHAVRDAGFDAVIGYSLKRDGSPFISEIFDVREITYPSKEVESDIHESFLTESLGEARSEQSIPETITINGKPRPTRNSNGQFIHPTLEGVKKFWEWFGESKVVDAQGRPLVVYHGTNKDFDKFDSRFISSGIYGDGFYFAYDPRDTVTKTNEDANLMPVYIKASNPITTGTTEYFDIVDKNDMSNGAFVNTRKLLSVAEKNGYDAVISGYGYSNQIVVSNPTQIKSATGNQGTFDATNPNILFQSSKDIRQQRIDHVKKMAKVFKAENPDATNEDIVGAIMKSFEKQGKVLDEDIAYESLKDYGYKKQKSEKAKKAVFPIGTTNAQVKASREMRGLEAIPKAERVRNKDLWENIINRINSGEINPRQTTIDIANSEEVETSPQREAIVKHDRLRIELEKKYLNEEIEEKLQSGENEGLIELYHRQVELENEMVQNDVAAEKLGRAGGSAMQFRQRNIEEDMSLAEIIREAQVLNGGQKLSAIQEAKFKALAAQYEKLKAEYDRLVAKEQERQEQLLKEQETKRKKAEEKLVNEIKDKTAKQGKKVADFDSMFKADIKHKKLTDKESEIKERLRDRLAKLANVKYAAGEESVNVVEELSGVIKDLSELGIVKLEQGIDSVLAKVKEYMLSVDKKFNTANLDKYRDKLSDKLNIKDVQATEYEKLIAKLIDKSKLGFDSSNAIKNVLKDILFNRVSVGRETIDEVVDEVYESVKDKIEGINKRKLRDAISGYGEFRKLSKEEIDTKIRELKRQGRLDSAIEDVESDKLPLRSGVERDVVTQETRQKQARILREIKDRELVPPPTEEEQEAQWRNGVQAYLRRLENAIADVTKEINTGERKQRAQRKKYDSPEIQSKRDELARLNAIKAAIDKESGVDFKQREDAVIKATERAIAEIQADMDKLSRNIPTDKRVVTRGKGRFGLASKTSEKITSERIDELRKLKEALQQQLSDMLPESVKDKALLEKYKKQRQRRLAELEEQKRTKDYGVKEPAAKPTLDKETIEINRKIERLKYDIEKEKETIRLDNRNLMERGAEAWMNAWNLSKALKSSHDLSAPYRQGLVMISKPKQFGKAFLAMFKFAFSSEAYENWLFDLKSTDDYYEMIENKLYLAEPHAKLAAKEEHFMSNWLQYIDKIPVYGSIRQGSERAYVGFLNKLRADVYLNFKNRLIKEGFKGEELQKELKSYAHFVNTATGRGRMTMKIGNKEVLNLEPIAPLLNTAFFSPRLIASRLAPFNPAFYANMSKEARKDAIKTYLASTGIILSTIGLLSIAFADDDDFSVEPDPRSSDFMKIRYRNLFFDLWGGHQQVARTIAQFLTGRTKKDGVVKKMEGDKWYGETRLGTVMNFFSNKLSPSAQLVKNVLQGGKDYEGEDLELFKTALEQVMPLYIDDMKEIIEEEGIEFAFIAGFPAMFGVGVQNYSIPDSTSSTSKKKLTPAEEIQKSLDKYNAKKNRKK